MISFFIIGLPLSIGLYVFVIQKRKKSRSINTANQQAFVEQVKTYSHFYHQLNSAEKDLFLQRTWMFYCIKKYEARGFSEVTERMKTIIASYAAQITFGYDDIQLQHFKTIIVYPEAYRSTVTNWMHKGETNKSGVVVFSWSDLAEGHNRHTDGVNLALHEFAHAVHLENFIPNEEFQFIDPVVLEAFHQIAESEIEEIRQTDGHFLREYGGTNHEEFFAVCVENFFERPQDFLFHHPKLYAMMSQILRLNPLQSPMRLAN